MRRPAERNRRTHPTTERTPVHAGTGAMNARPLSHSEPFASPQPWAGSFRNGGNGARAAACPSLSPFMNGDSEEHARSCQRMSPFRNGANGERAMLCLLFVVTVYIRWKRSECHRVPCVVTDYKRRKR